MSGLREKQKADRRRRMISAASKLFADQGYEATSMEAIAELAEVSVGTVYNYYETKSEILLAIVVDEGESVFLAGEELLREPPFDARSVMHNLVLLYLNNPLNFMGKNEWRQVIALSVLHPNARFGQGYLTIERRLAMQVGSIIEELAEKGELKDVGDPNSLGKTVFNTINAAFLALLYKPQPDIERAVKETLKEIDAILHGYFP